MGQLYSIKEETLVAIADNVRAITGTTGELTPGEMTTSSGEISTEVSTQTELIEQIQTALEGKAGGSGEVEDLSAELAEQANLIAQQQTLISNLETALENKAGGSGDGSVTQGTFTVVDNGMYEPGMNKFTLSTDNLNLSTRNCVLIFGDYGGSNLLAQVIYRANTSESFRVATNGYASSSIYYVLDENEITLLLSSANFDYIATFIAY